MYMNKQRKIFLAATVSLILIITIELISYAAGIFLQSRWKMYKIPLAIEHPIFNSFNDYLQIRDPVVGWPFSTSFGERPLNIRGTGGNDAYPRFASDDCVGIYGDSFALATEVILEDSWGYLLSKRLNCAVGIYGVNSYGTDQAYLRFKQRTNDSAKVVILTHLSENIIRNLTRNFDLYTGVANYSLKPRFVLDTQNKLKLVPLPEITEKEYLHSIAKESPQLILGYENFHVGGSAGEVSLSFPYSISVLQNILSFRMLSAFKREPDYAQFYSLDHPMKGLGITAGILREFSLTAKSRDQIPLVVLLPTKHDLRYFNKTGKWTYATLIAKLNSSGIRFINFGDHLFDNIGERDYESFFMPLGHYNEDINKMLTEFVFKEIGKLQ